MPAPWADQPFALFSTQSFDKKLSHGAYYAATQMAGAHNGVIRGLNAIYLQAPALPPGDTSIAADFLTYCQCWCEGLKHHHDAKEKNYFPRLERLSNQPGLMDHNVEQHAAFGVGFTAFHDYVNTCDPKDFDAAKVKLLIHAFAEPLTTHLHDEIDTLRELDKYDSAEVRKAYDELDAILRAGDVHRIAPLVVGTADTSFEGGRHGFPELPFFVPYLVHYYLERRHRGAWRFNPCTSWRVPRELAFKPPRVEGAKEDSR